MRRVEVRSAKSEPKPRRRQPATAEKGESATSQPAALRSRHAGRPLLRLSWSGNWWPKRAELPVATVQDEHRMLSDLHLNSITVGQLVSEAARHLGLPRVLGLTDFANASVAEMARALEELKQAGGGPRTEDSRRQPPGVDIWTEGFTVDLVEAPRPGPGRAGNADSGGHRQLR